MLLLLVAALVFIVLVFSPLVIELKKPRDRGPRRILRTPFERRIRSNSGKPVTVGPDLVNDPNFAGDLEAILNNAGVKATRIGNDTIRISSSIVLAPHVKVSDNLVIEGALKIGEHCVFHRSIKAKGEVLVGNGVVIDGNLVSEGNVTIMDQVVIGGAVHSEGSVKIGESVFIALSVVANGDVELHDNSEVKKNILTRGIIKTLRHPRVDLPPTIDEIG